MRLIKFRAWNKQLKHMYESVDIRDFRIHNYFRDTTEELILMQFTGLHDCKRKEIYEGDIIKTYNSQYLYVKWDYDQWGLFDGICNEASIDRDNDEVIGNVYENPELLENAQ